MCLITEQKKPIKIRKDMIVYKQVKTWSVGEEITSIFYDFIWELGSLYKCEFNQEKYGAQYFDDATYDFYSVIYKGEYRSLNENIKDGIVKAISKGFHSGISLKRLKHPFRRFAKCIIPAGSLIYKDKTGLIVSNQIKMIEIVK